jgi:putative transposase
MGRPIARLQPIRYDVLRPGKASVACGGTSCCVHACPLLHAVWPRQWDRTRVSGERIVPTALYCMQNMGSGLASMYSCYAVLYPSAYLLACYRYIELNPLRAGMVQDPVEYPWSNSRWHALGQPDPIITDHALYLALGSRPQERRTVYRALCQEHLHASLLQEIRATVHQGRVLGTERFKDAIETVLARRVRPGKAGRPRKTPSSQTTLAAPVP